MGLIDKLIDKVFDSIKKNKTDNVIKQLKKNNPALAKAADNHKQTYDEFVKQMEKAVKDRASK
tara:strand:+ start:169 stop:357 length:189 start_codon:yes stop_codon:yes gene_type:complete